MSASDTRNEERSRATQVGFVMKSYRESFLREDRQRGISQSDLLHRMASVDPEHGQRLSHGTVSRWESGYTLPTAQRLEIFSKAIGLSETEATGLILMAGLDPEQQKSRKLNCPRCGSQTKTVDDVKTRRRRGPIAATRTRKCPECEFTAQSTERWANDPEETSQRSIEQVLRRIERANDQIRDALAEAETIQHPQPPEKEPRENQSPSGGENQHTS